MPELVGLAIQGWLPPSHFQSLSPFVFCSNSNQRTRAFSERAISVLIYKVNAYEAHTVLQALWEKLYKHGLILYVQKPQEIVLLASPFSNWESWDWGTWKPRSQRIWTWCVWFLSFLPESLSHRHWTLLGINLVPGYFFLWAVLSPWSPLAPCADIWWVCPRCAHVGLNPRIRHNLGLS